VPQANLLPDPSQSILILKVIKQAFQEKYKQYSSEAPSSDKMTQTRKIVIFEILLIQN
jgi:hypothetical protein